jgi:flavin reductase (DIM6/NTAB) family NADH-FMN oxidoreductase RutF
MNPFDAVVGDLDPAMAIVTTAVGDERAGCLVGFHSQCSIEPPRYAVWLSKANHTLPVAFAADHVAVHFLSDADVDLAELFGTHTGDTYDKFARCAWTPAEGSGVPLLDRCGHRIVLRRTGVLDEGSDHVCFTGEPVLVATVDGPFTPLRLSAVAHFHPGHEATDH